MWWVEGYEFVNIKVGLLINPSAKRVDIHSSLSVWPVVHEVERDFQFSNDMQKQRRLQRKPKLPLSL